MNWGQATSRHRPCQECPPLCVHRCDVAGWSSAADGTPCPARAVSVEDSGAGVATLVYGGDWGLRLLPRDGREPFGEPYLLLDAEAILE